MTQLYSNLVKYVNNTTYLCLVLAVLCSLVVTGVRLALLHTQQLPIDQSPHIISSLMSHMQLSKCPPFYINHGEQRRVNTWL